MSDRSWKMDSLFGTISSLEGQVLVRKLFPNKESVAHSRDVPWLDRRLGSGNNQTIYHWETLMAICELRCDCFFWSCASSPKARPILNYGNTLKIPRTGLLNTFRMNFSGPLPPCSNGKVYLLIAVGHPTGWATARISTRDTSGVDFLFV